MKDLQIVYQDKEILVINKPSSLSTQGGATIKKSVDTMLRAQIGHAIYLIHRLDRDTSGLLVVALTKDAASKWAAILSSKNVVKTYEAICITDNFSTKSNSIATPNFPMSATINSPIIEHGVKKCAVTHYKVIPFRNVLSDSQNISTSPNCNNLQNNFTENSFNDKNILLTLPAPNNQYALARLQVTLDTGRMHQIRIHLMSVGLPIALDDKHGNFFINKILKKTLKIKTLQLCCVKLQLPNITLTLKKDEIPLYSG